MNKGDVQSVILNFNKNFANSKGYQFTQLVNQQLEIHPNSMVALYTGNLVRKPIVVPEDTQITINLTSQFPTQSQSTTVDLNQIDSFGITSFVATVKAGHYSKLTFCRHFVQVLNKVIEDTLNDRISQIYPFNGGDPAQKNIPYRFVYEMKEGEFYLGLRYMLEKEATALEIDNSMVSFLDLNDGCNTSQAITFVEDDAQIVFHRTSRANDWNSYALGNQPIKGMSYCKTGDDIDKLATDISYSTCQIQARLPASGTQDMEFLYALDNTYFASKWADQSPANVETSNITYVPADKQVPNCLIGAYFDLSASTTEMTQQSLMIVVNENISKLTLQEYSTLPNRDAFLGSELQIVKEIDLSNYQIDLSYLTTFRWEVYCENRAPDDADDFILEDEREYYFRLYTSSPYEQASSQMLFDSKQIGLELNKDVVETGYLWQQIENYDVSTASVSGGLCPQFFFKNSADDLVVYNPRQNSIATLINDRQNFAIQYGFNGYSFEVKSEDNTNTSALQSILGVGENREQSVLNLDITQNTNFNPNNYPKTANLAGLTQLGSDRTRYNIELNLPIKAYNTTESSVNNLGQQRTIVYNTNPVVEDVTNVNTGLINASIDPNNIKFLSLNNERELKLNNLDVSIRRAKTNELAEEITDASIELLIQSEPKNQEMNVLV